MRKILKCVFSVIIALTLFFVCFSLISGKDFSVTNHLQRIIPFYIDDVDIDFEEEFGTKPMYYYNHLSESEKQDYLRMYSAIMNFEESCELKVDKAQMIDIFDAVKYDNPEIFWLSNSSDYSSFGYSTILYFNYIYDESEIREMKVKLDKKVAEIVAEASQYNTDYEKEKFLHDYICENVFYDDATFGTTGGTVSQTLLNGSAICEGYAKSMQLLLNGTGIYNYLVLGDAVFENKPTERHMWNVVEIDGNNYYLDVTWDDFQDSDSYCYMYFNVTDKDIAEDHQNIVPSNNNCDSYEANYFYVTGYFLQSFDGFDKLVTPTAEILKGGSTNAEFKFVNKEDFDNALAATKDNTAFFIYIGDSVTKSGQDLSKTSISYFAVDGMNYLCISFIDG